MAIERIKGVIAPSTLPSAFPILEGLELPGAQGLYTLTSPNDAAEILGRIIGNGNYTQQGLVLDNSPALILNKYDTEEFSITLAVYTPAEVPEYTTVFSCMGSLPGGGWRVLCNSGTIQLVLVNDAGQQRIYPGGNMHGGWTVVSFSVAPGQARIVRSNTDYDYPLAYTRRMSTGIPVYVGTQVPGTVVAGHSGTFGAMIVSSQAWDVETHRKSRNVLRSVMAARGVSIA